MLNKTMGKVELLAVGLVQFDIALVGWVVGLPFLFFR